MNARFVQVDAVELSQLQRNPSMAEALFEDQAVGMSRFFALNRNVQDRARTARAVSAVAESPILSLEKAWHGVHYVLCGQPEPGSSLLSQVILGGAVLGEDDEGFSGYGPPRYFTSGHVAQLSRTLSRPEMEAEAAGRFNAARMSQLRIYPGWQPSDGERVMNAFRRLRDFYADARAKGNAMVTCLV
jgi:hypothetical protein